MNLATRTCSPSKFCFIIFQRHIESVKKGGKRSSSKGGENLPHFNGYGERRGGGRGDQPTEAVIVQLLYLFISSVESVRRERKRGLS